MRQQQKEMTPYLATAIAEGVCEGEDATFEQTMEAWSFLIRTGMVWQLQGWFGRTAVNLIESGYIDSDGNINWDFINDHLFTHQ